MDEFYISSSKMCFTCSHGMSYNIGPLRNGSPGVVGSHQNLERITFSHCRNENVLQTCHPAGPSLGLNFPFYSCPHLQTFPAIRPGSIGRRLCLPNWVFTRNSLPFHCLFCFPSRHNTYLQECTGQREPTYQLNIHDIKLLFLRFAMEQSFSADTGGGGRESNIHLIPYIIHTVLYVLNTSVPCVPGAASRTLTLHPSA